MAAEEIVRLKVGITRATEAQISRLERLDRVLAALRQQSTVNIRSCIHKRLSSVWK